METKYRREYKRFKRPPRHRPVDTALLKQAENFKIKLKALKNKNN